MNQKTVAKWRMREGVADLPTGPREPKSTVLTPEEEAIIVAFRRHTLLPLDDCLYSLQSTIPHLSRSSLHRCLQRHDISRLPEITGDKPAKKKFKAYPIGYFHIRCPAGVCRQTPRGDIAEVQTAEGKLYLFVGIDRTSKFAFVRLETKATRTTATAFLVALIKAVPYKIHTVLTDNGIQFTFPPRYADGPTATWMSHMFDMRCEENGIEHRLTKIRHPLSVFEGKHLPGNAWTNGQVERIPLTVCTQTVAGQRNRTITALSTDDRFTYVTSPVAGIPDFLTLNTKVSPFDNVKVRQAIALAINRDDIKQVAYMGTGEAGLTEMPTGSRWYDATGVFGATQDIDAAKKLLAEAGYPNGLTVEYLGLSQYPELLKTGPVVREQLKSIGIDMTIKAVDVSVWYDAFVSGNFQITSAYQERTIDPDNFYSLVIRSGRPINTSGYANPAVDALIDQAASIADDAARMGIYRQVRTLFSADAPLVFTHYETLNYLMNKNVAGSTISPTLSLHIENIGFTD